MSNRRARKKLQRAAYGPGGSLMYVPPMTQQGVLGQTFYGSKLNIPVQQAALFSPGTPLPPQQGTNPNGLPIAAKFPISYNTFPPSRSFYEEMPSFEQLRRLAIMDYGITLCERYWLDMVPQMTLKIGLKQEYISDGAEEKDYQKEITFFKNFFSKPDGQQNIHEWIQQALVEQSQIDELYIYKHRTRGGKLLGLQIVAGDQMKPLLDDWGRMPDGKSYAYQQYPWGIPGMQYTADQIIHRRETPAVNTPYGRGRVERVLLITNTALRKQKQDLARFTDGNIPAGMVEVPESLSWTPDQIDAYEQSWNALMAGNLQQLARVKFMQPGMKYIPFVQPSFDSVIDRYWLSIRASVYGVPMDELGFTETSNRSVGEIQQDVVYRRTIGPHAKVYAVTLTDVMNNDFPPEMKGDMFEVSFGGYEEQEDDQAKAATLTMYTNAGVLGLSAAAKIANLPEDAGAPQIGRVYMSKDGPIFLDDMASDKMRNAAADAKLAGFQMAANPPEPAQAPGGQGDGGSDGSSDNGDDEEVDKAMSAADKAAASLSRSDPVRGPGGEFGYEGKAKSSSGHHGGSKKGSHHAKGPRVPAKQRMHARMQKLSARFARLASRKVGPHWSAAQAKAAGQLKDTFSKIADAISKGGQSDAIDSLLDTAHSQAKGVFAGNAKGMNAFAGALTAIDKANDKGLLRAIEIEFEDEDEPEFEDLEDMLDSMEDEQDMLARVSDMLASVEEHLRKLRAQSETEPRMVSQQGTCDCETCKGNHGRLIFTHEEMPPFHDGCDCSMVEKGEEHNVTRAQPSTEDEARSTLDFKQRLGGDDSGGPQSEYLQSVGRGDDRAKSIATEYRRWRDKAVKAVSLGRASATFVSDIIPAHIHTYISGELARCTTADDVRALFKRVQDGPIPHWQDDYPAIGKKLEALDEAGVETLTWKARPGACDNCMPNDGQTVRVGQKFKSGARIPPEHGNCGCDYIDDKGRVWTWTGVDGEYKQVQEGK